MIGDSRLAVLQFSAGQGNPGAAGISVERKVRAGAKKIVCSASIVVISTAARIG